MYYLIQGYKRVDDRLEATPSRTQAVTINQLAGTIIRMLATGIDVVEVTAINEDTFMFFYQEKKRDGGTRI